MGYARNFQPPSFFNPFSGYYGANTGMGGFQSQFGGFQQPQFGGFGGFQQPQFGGFGGFGGFQQPQYGGFQQPQYGGFQQPFGGGFSQPSFGNPFSRGFNPRTMPPQMRPQPMPQPLPVDDTSARIQPMPIGGGAYQPGVGNQRIEMGSGMGGFGGFNSMTGMQGELVPRAVQPTTEMERQMEGRPYHTGAFGPPNFGGGGMGNFGGFNPMMGGGIGAFGGLQQQFNPYGNAYAEPPQQAQRGTVDQNMNNPAFKQQQDAYNMTDYQRLMQRKDRAANAPPAPPAPPMSGMTGLGGMPIRAPSDYEIAGSLGFKDPNAGRDMLTWVLPDEEYKKRDIQKQSDAKKYLDSIGYGQTGFDPSKYEVKREVRPSSGLGSLFSGFGRGFA
jgi:hypothetical protein